MPEQPKDHPSSAAAVDLFLQLDQDAFARQCEFHPHRSGGPGGQKRNKTSSAVRLVHRPTGLVADSGDFRSQAENRLRALHRLRLRLALECRSTIVLTGYEPPAWLRPYAAGGTLHVNPKNPAFARAVAHVLDVTAAAAGNVPRTAALLGVSSSSLTRWLKEEPAVWQALAAIRRANGLSADPFGR